MSDYYLNKPYPDEYLSHHGILGMKWGDRNGPPYPLGSGDHTSKQKSLAAKAGIKVGGDSGLGENGGARQLDSKRPLQRDHRKQNPTSNKSKSKQKQKKGMDPRKKRAIAIGVGVTAGLIAAYAAYRIPRNKKMHENIDPDTGLRLKDHIESEAEDLAAVNKDRRGKLFDSLTQGYSNNCYLCTTAYELRRRGYDVSAKMAWGKNPDYADKIFNNVEHHPTYWNKMSQAASAGFFHYMDAFDDNQSSAIKQFESDAKKMGPNARGNLCLMWRQGGGHSIIWENDAQGNLHLLDAQTNREYKEGLGEEGLLKYAIPGDYFRTDNLSLKKTDELKEAVQDNLALDSGLNEKQGAAVATGLSALAGMGVADYNYHSNTNTYSKNSKSNKEGKNNAERRRS